ncbi:uncharacterized protein [Branchiostoma lanceolatum]|uniref:uncharacterized protein n=1 Tax=Branchiostoma lanceolatum TaxID=7740 RepID=UPI0034539374
MRTIFVSGATLLLAVAIVVSTQGVAHGYNCNPPWSRACVATDTTGFGRRAMDNQTTQHRGQPPVSDVDTAYEDDVRNLLVQILRSHMRPRTSRRWTVLEE